MTTNKDPEGDSADQVEKSDLTNPPPICSECGMGLLEGECVNPFCEESDEFVGDDFDDDDDEDEDAEP